MNRITVISLVASLGILLTWSQADTAGFVWPNQGECRRVSGFHYPDTQDSDGDTLRDWQEDVNENCVVEDGETDRNNQDTDGDGIRDDFEQNRMGATDNCQSSWDCDGDGRNNGSDTDSDGDGLPDNEENCSGDIQGTLLGERVFNPGCTQTPRFASNRYHWEETNPYNADSDGDGFLDQDDLCPRSDAGGNPEGPDFACVAQLCRRLGLAGATFEGINENFDTDRDGEPDIQEDLDKNCRLLTPAQSSTSTESNPYVADTDGDGKSDGSDECPQDNDLDCKGVCQPTGDAASGAINAATEQPVNRNNFDTDDDGIVDAREDVDGDCEYDAPVEGEFSSVETDWQNPDTDGDAAQFRQGALGVGNDRIDDCPHLNPQAVPAGADAETVRRFSYPGCLVYYCSPAYGEHAFQIAANRHTDSDGLDDTVEDPNGDCLPGTNPLETDPLNADTDGDGANDDVDPCPHLAGATYCPEICPLQGGSSPLWAIWSRLDSDGDGLNNVQEDSNHNCEIDLFETDPFLSDTDGDGFEDYYDSCGNTGNDGHTAWLNLDSDGDGKPNGQEDSDNDCIRDPFESDPFNPDTDGDGIDDFSDACPYSASSQCLQRCSATAYQTGGAAELDSDGDGLKNGEEDTNKDCVFFGEFGNGGEVQQPFDTNPYLRDSDGDGISDRVDGCQEADSAILADVNVPVSGSEMDCARNQCLEAAGVIPGTLKDSDRDGIPDIKEDLNSDCIVSVDPNGEVAETDRFNPDTDGDGILDGVEDKNRNGQVDKEEANPRVADTDNDGILDGAEDQNKNGRVDFGESDPKNSDSDSDTILDQFEDKNLDGIWQGGQLRNTGPCRAFDEEGKPVSVAPGQLETSAYLKDSDLDAIPDEKEDKNKNGIFTDVAKLFGSEFLKSEEDGAPEPSAETVSEFGETHPCDADTDHDGLLDGQEDRNQNGALDIPDGETSPISPNTFGEPDISRFERRLGISGCSLIP